MTNKEMTPNRFLRWHRSRQRVKTIQDHLKAGGSVLMCTHCKQTRFDPKHIGMFSASRNGAFVQRGRSNDCIDGVTFLFSKF
jgi:hypothetical protein